MRILPINSLLLLGFLFCVGQLNAQSRTVLVNGVPTNVKMVGAEVTEVSNEVKNYMNGFESPTSDSFTKASPVAQPIVRRATAATTKPKVRNIEMDKEMNFDNSLFFEPGKAKLTTKAISAIKDYAAKLKSGQAKSVLLKSWHLAGNKISKQLTQERLDACKASFVSQGIGANVILSSLTAAQEESKFVTITLE